MKMSKAEQNIRKLIAATETELNQEIRRLIILEDTVRAVETTIGTLKRKSAELCACLGESPPDEQEEQAEQPASKPRRRRTRKKQTTDVPPAESGNGATWYLCSACKERFKRPAVVDGKEVCPDCESENIEPVPAVS